MSAPCQPKGCPPNCLPMFGNHEQACTVICPDGSSFTWVVDANTVMALSQVAADGQAEALACKLAKQQRLCFFDAYLPPCCKGYPYVFQLDASGGSSPYTWSVSGGMFPTGISMDITGTISGTTNDTGMFNVQIQITDNQGSVQYKTYDFVISEITPDPLPDGATGVAYSQNLSVSPTHDQETETWTIVSGALPDGLELTTAGIIKGTPTADGSFHFVVKAAATLNNQAFDCQHDYTLTIGCSLPLPGSYFKFDEVGGNREDALHFAFELQPQFAVPVGSAAGKINLAAFFVGSLFPYPTLSSTPYTEVYLRDLGTGWCWAGWVKNISGVPTPLQFGLYDLFLNDLGAFHLVHNGPGNHWQVIGRDNNSTLYTVIQTDAAIPLGSWSFFRIWFDPATGLVHLQINDGTIADSNVAGLVFAGSEYGSLDIYADAVGANMLVDEYGYWQVPLTDCQASALYNAGAGKTCCPFA